MVITKKHIEQYQGILDIVSELSNELKPICEIASKLRSTLDIDGTIFRDNVLSNLMLRLTTTSRRHDLNKRVMMTRNERHYTIGTNHRGIGYKSRWSSQLSPMSEVYNDRQDLRDVLLDDDAVLELTTIIKKSNQPTFLKAVKILKKHKLQHDYTYYKSKIIKPIQIKIDDNNKINIGLDYDSTIEISVLNCDGDGVSASVRLHGNNVNIIRDEETKILKKINNKYPVRLTIQEIKVIMFILQYSEKIVTELKEMRKDISLVVSKYKKENNELNDLLSPLLALEKL